MISSISQHPPRHLSPESRLSQGVGFPISYPHQVINRDERSFLNALDERPVDFLPSVAGT